MFRYLSIFDEAENFNLAVFGDAVIYTMTNCLSDPAALHVAAQLLKLNIPDSNYLPCGLALGSFAGKTRSFLGEKKRKLQLVNHRGSRGISQLFGSFFESIGTFD